MKTLTVGEFKANFSDVVAALAQGQEIAISYGKNKKKIGVVVPMKSYKRKNKIRLGLLKGKAKVTFKKGFKMTIDEFLNLKTS